MTEKTKESTVLKIAKSGLYQISRDQGNVWSPDNVDKLESRVDYKIGATVDMQHSTYYNLVNNSRFFYRKDPLASTVVNKLVEIAINDLWLDQGNLPANQFRLFLAMKPMLLSFAERMALEYLLSGLVVPEVSFAALTKEQTSYLGIKKVESRTFPVEMWLRDPMTIKMYTGFLQTDEPLYYVKIPTEAINFVMSGGLLPNNIKDTEALTAFKARYPKVYQAIMDGKTELKLDNPYIIRRRPLTDMPFPTPYLQAALESLKHKRNLRRMDYALASRVIAAILHVSIGSDEFPVTEDDGDRVTDIESQLYWRNSGETDMERTFTLVTDHTTKLEWVAPDAGALLDDAKYKDINQDIVLALGFPGILITGETGKSNVSQPDFAVLSPENTMENMRNKILQVLRYIVTRTAELNSLSDVPEIRFRKMRLTDFKGFFDALATLYADGNISRETLDEFVGFSFIEEAKKRAKEAKLIKELGIEAFAPKAFSPQPQAEENKNKDKEDTKEPEKEE